MELTPIHRNSPAKLDPESIDPDFLLKAYRLGVFPMAVEGREMAWFCPEQRGVIALSESKVPHGLWRFLKKNPFQVRVDSAFEEVMEGCADRKETWIDEIIKKSYGRLFELGHAHSVEAWLSGQLVGGLYGVVIGGVFFGESMFSRVSESSKVCLAFLLRHLEDQGFDMVDTQWVTSHLMQFGAVEMPKAEYLRRLDKAVELEVSFV